MASSLFTAGLIFLLVGQFMTEIFQVESTMRIEVGGTKELLRSPPPERSWR